MRRPRTRWATVASWVMTTSPSSGSMVATRSRNSQPIGSTTRRSSSSALSFMATSSSAGTGPEKTRYSHPAASRRRVSTFRKPESVSMTASRGFAGETVMAERGRFGRRFAFDGSGMDGRERACSQGFHRRVRRGGAFFALCEYFDRLIGIFTAPSGGLATLASNETLSLVRARFHPATGRALSFGAPVTAARAAVTGYTGWVTGLAPPARWAELGRSSESAPATTRKALDTHRQALRPCH